MVYYEVLRFGKWGPRAAQYPPRITKEMKVIHTQPKEIAPEHEHLSLDELREIYGEKHDSTEEVPTTDSGADQA